MVAILQTLSLLIAQMAHACLVVLTSEGSYFHIPIYWANRRVGTASTTNAAYFYLGSALPPRVQVVASGGSSLRTQKNMAVVDPTLSLLDEVTCAICLDYFTHPVTIDCGHTFCLECIQNHIKKHELLPLCPECRKSFRDSNLNPNKRMANIVEVIQRPKTMPKPANLCEEHQERLQLFCRTDESAICMVCHESQQHKLHDVLPLKEAAETYKPVFLKNLGDLKAQLAEVSRLKTDKEVKSADFQKVVLRERQKIVSEFEDLQRFVKEQQSSLLNQLDEKEAHVLRGIQRSVRALEDLQTSLNQLITDIEGKCQQEDVELLKDTKTLLARCKAAKVPEPVSTSREEKNLQHFYQQHVDLQRMITNFREWRRARCFAVDVTLDPETAHPHLDLSDDLKSVTFGAMKRDLPVSQKRFNNCALVLGREGLCSGRHYWEVVVGDKTDWGLGVCKQSVNREQTTNLQPKNGYWGLWMLNGDTLWASTTPFTRLTPMVRPRTVGVFLDFELGKVSFYSTEDRSLLFTFNDTFTEALYPFLSPSQLEDGRNASPLIIRSVKISKADALALPRSPVQEMCCEMGKLGFSN